MEGTADSKKRKEKRQPSTSFRHNKHNSAQYCKVLSVSDYVAKSQAEIKGMLSIKMCGVRALIEK